MNALWGAWPHDAVRCFDDGFVCEFRRCRRRVCPNEVKGRNAAQVRSLHNGRSRNNNKAGEQARYRNGHAAHGSFEFAHFQGLRRAYRVAARANGHALGHLVLNVEQIGQHRREDGAHNARGHDGGHGNRRRSAQLASHGKRDGGGSRFRQCGKRHLVAQAEQLAARQQIISAEGMLTQYRETLRALIGADAQSMPAIHPVALPALQETLPPSLSFELLARRPDLQALRGYVTASLSQVDAAKAAFYPHFDIKAFWGYNALSVGDLFKSSFQQINLLPGLYLPIFDGGRLNANLQSVRTASNILIKQYNQAVLDAVRDVAISSSQLNDLNQQRALQQLKVTAAQTTTDSARAHYQRGLLSRYAAEEARRAVLAQQLLLLDIEAQRLSTDITLIKALGGGYRGQ